MSAKRSVTPLTINTKSNINGKTGVVTAAAFRYDESAPPKRRTSMSSNRPGSRQASIGTSSPRRQLVHDNSMSAYQAAAAGGQAMFVRALYDYDAADDRTSLSFRQGDIIQVITQLDSGWWDGILDGVRGWFPSNYCAVVSNVSDGDMQDGNATSTDEGESGTEDEYDQLGTAGQAAMDRGRQRSRADRDVDEEAPFWIPQATPDGRLYYYNTLTHVSTMELPLQTPTSINEKGPHSRANMHAPNQTRPPPEMMVGGFEREEDETSASEVEESMMHPGRRQLRQRRRSHMSDGASPTASMESLNASPNGRGRNDSRDYYRSNRLVGPMSAGGATVPTYAGNLLGQFSTSTIPRSFHDDGHAPPVTWNRLIDNMQKSVESYRQAISNADRVEYVRKAEEISDHLRMLLAAGSGTTDNHSGNPSVISMNKALYPHFRDMMSRFSKLVLSSHIAAADWPAPDSYAKCLQEAEGVLNGVKGYVDIARAQRGEEIPRLTPGFVLGSNIGGSWQNNSSGPRDFMTSSFMDQDEYDNLNDPSVKLDVHLLEHLEDLKRVAVSNIKRLEENLNIPEKLITAARHEQLSTAICAAASKVVECFRPYVSSLESINLSALGNASQSSQVSDFATQKQRLYDLVASLVVSCQIVAGPLADEWAEIRGEPLEDRVQEVRNIANTLEKSLLQITITLQTLLSSMPAREGSKHKRMASDGGNSFDSTHTRNMSRNRIRPQIAEMQASASFSEGVEPSADAFKKNPKLKKFFGEDPTPQGAVVVDEVPSFLKLDHESQIAYDRKTEPPQLRGGSLMALVEQLTRHDRLDAGFNNTFLLTYRSFTTAAELFELLVKRFTVQPPRGISQEEYRMWVDKKQKPIRFRVVNILKSWFDTYWLEENDEASNDLLRRVYAFAKDSVVTSNTPGSGPLISVIEQRLRGQDPGAARSVVPSLSQVPQPILPKNMRKLKFLDIDVTEFARQLTIIESKLYGKIKPAECLSKTWQKKIGPDEADPAPNVKALILHSNQLTNWVAEMILTQTDVKKRVVVIKHFVNIAEKCRQLNNFSTLTSVISALGTAPIHRLNRTWNSVNARTSTTLETLRRLMGSTKNFGEYRDTLHSANPPCIPFFGVYLTDLTFIEDGIPSLIKKSDLINFAKRSKTAEVIRDIQQYQNVPYPLQPVPELQDYIISNMQAAGDVHEMYDRSLTVEPREREDEKIARLLSESGFL